MTYLSNLILTKNEQDKLKGLLQQQYKSIFWIIFC